VDEEEEGASTHHEPYAADGRHPAVKIRDLKKVYPGGKVAVENLTLEVYEDHITALLGHNGAGKSTTISILTGLIRPTGGDAHIWGHSIRDNMNDVRR
jgi:ATP-binding cassette subfamily A (ABC1) protein 3